MAKDYTHHKAQCLAALQAGQSIGMVNRETGVPHHVIIRWRDEAGIVPKKAGYDAKSRKLYANLQDPNT